MMTSRGSIPLLGMPKRLQTVCIARGGENLLFIFNKTKKCYPTLERGYICGVTIV